MLLVNTHQLKELNKEYQFWVWGTKSNGMPEKFVFIVCGVWRIHYQPHTHLSPEGGMQTMYVDKWNSMKKKLKYVIMWCTVLIFRPLRRINAQKFCFKLARETLAFKETNYDEVKALYMRKCHCTIFHVLLLLEKIWDQYIDSIRVCLWCK